MPEPISNAPLPFLVACDRGSFDKPLEIRSLDGTQHFWSAPPVVLDRLLVDLFAAQPEDVLSWVHLAVWRMRGEDLLTAPSSRASPSRDARATKGFYKNSCSSMGSHTKLFRTESALSQDWNRFRVADKKKEDKKTHFPTTPVSQENNLAASPSPPVIHDVSLECDQEDNSDALALSVNRQQDCQKTASARSIRQLSGQERLKSFATNSSGTRPSDVIGPEYSDADVSIADEDYLFDPSPAGSPICTPTREARLNRNSAEKARKEMGTKESGSMQFANSGSGPTSSGPTSIGHHLGTHMEKRASRRRSAQDDGRKTKGRMSRMTYRLGDFSGVNQLWTRFQLPPDGRSSQRSNQSDETDQSWVVNFKAPSGASHAENASHQPLCDCEALPPSSSIYLVWNFIFTMCLLFDLWATSFALSYLPDASNQPGWLDALLASALAVFSFDIIFNFFVGYTRNGVVMLRLSDASLHYFFTWFWVDLLATLPYFISLAFRSASQGLRWLALLRLLRLLRVHRWMRQLPDLVEVSWQFEYALSLLRSLWVLAIVAHFNAICWASMQPSSWEAHNVSESFKRYLESLWWAFALLTCSSDAPITNQSSEQFLSIFIALQRLILFLFLVSTIAWQQTKDIGLHDFAQSALQQRVLAYLRRARLPTALQMDLVRVLKVNKKVRFQQMHFDALAEQDLPRDLRVNISLKLWGQKLRSFALLDEIMKWDAEFEQELAMTVRHEYFPPYAQIYVIGEFSNAAFLVLSGRLGSTDRQYDWLPGMWVGEKAMVNPDLKRTESIHAKECTELMMLPARELQKMLTTFELQERFTSLLHKRLWKGLCGRCGAFGDHFDHDCPRIIPFRSWSHRLDRGFGSYAAKDGKAVRNKSNTADHGFDKDLNEFIIQHEMEHLRGLLRKYNISGLDDINREILDTMVQDPEYQFSAFEAEFMFDASSKFKYKLRRNTEGLLNTGDDTDTHLIFLSHSKSEAGTEAALMKKDLELLIQDDPTEHASDIFLDSEDLRDLSQLQRHVEQSQNLVLLLTEKVLTRPWVLVEIVTANRVGTRIVLVEIQRRDLTYRFPDEDFFLRLGNRTELDQPAYNLLSEQNIDLEELVTTLRHVFQRIALPFSPHKTANVRQAELQDILKQCKINPRGSATPARGLMITKTKSWHAGLGTGT